MKSRTIASTCTTKRHLNLKEMEVLNYIIDEGIQAIRQRTLQKILYPIIGPL
jgi:hypothetical protein